MKTDDFKWLSKFTCESARTSYALRIAQRMADAMRNDPRLVEDTIVRGRVGLAALQDSDLLETGAIWEVVPKPGELRASLH